ncbi:hypothetical protein SARC_18155, partial [Sphaeroforma arctica JP610]
VKLPVVLTFKNITYTVSTNSGPLTILHGVSGAFKPGKLAAIMV